VFASNNVMLQLLRNW